MVIALADLLMERFKVRTRAVVNPLAVTSLGTTAQLVLSNNPNRLGWLIINLSTNTVYLHFENDVASTKGTLLDPSGGAASMVWDEDFQATGWSIWGVASGASSAIYAFEILSY